MTNTTSKPETVIRIGNISAAIWKRPGKEGNGHFYSVQLQRSYRTIDGTQYIDSFNHEDLLNVAAVVKLAEQWITGTLAE